MEGAKDETAPAPPAPAETGAPAGVPAGVPAGTKAPVPAPPLLRPAADGLRVISFDLDDTIWHCEPVLKRAGIAQHEFMLTEWPAMKEVLPGPEAFEPLFKAAMEEAKAKELAHHYTFTRRRAIELSAERAGLDPNEVVDKAFEAFIAARSTVSDHIFPDVVDVLRGLKDRGFTLVALTNGNCDLSRVAELSDLFEHHVSAEMAGAAKPDPRPFQKVLDLTGVSDPAHVLHIGDSLSSDVEGARAFGMRTVWVDRAQTGREHPADVVVRCVSELEAALGAFHGEQRADE